MQQQSILKVNPNLTGFQRFLLVKHWYKLGKPCDKEEYIRKACKQKGIMYTPPVTVKRVV